MWGRRWASGTNSCARKINKQNTPASAGSLQPRQSKTPLHSPGPANTFFHGVLKINPLVFNAPFNTEGLAMLLHEEQSWEERWGIGGRWQTDMLPFPPSFQTGASLSWHDHRTQMSHFFLLKITRLSFAEKAAHWCACNRYSVTPCCLSTVTCF